MHYYNFFSGFGPNLEILRFCIFLRFSQAEMALKVEKEIGKGRDHNRHVLAHGVFLSHAMITRWLFFDSI